MVVEFQRWYRSWLGIWSYRPTSTTSRYRPVLTTQVDGRLAAIADFTVNLGEGQL
jgi:hypothetical protein